jgi:hypothetical protein
VRWQQVPQGSEEYVRLGIELFDEFHSWTYNIGLVGRSPNPVVYREDIGNFVGPPEPYGPPSSVTSWLRDVVYLID